MPDIGQKVHGYFIHMMQQLARHGTGQKRGWINKQGTKFGWADRDTADRQAEGRLHFKADEEPDRQADDVLNRLTENDPGCHARSLDS